MIENIQSRFVMVSLRLPDKVQIAGLFDRIVSEEGGERLQIEGDAREFMLSVCQCRPVMVMNALEKCALYGRPVSLEVAKQLCSMIDVQKWEYYVVCLKERRLVDATNVLYEMYDMGYSVIDILDSCFEFIKTTDLLSEDEKCSLVPYVCKYISVYYDLHDECIELSLFTAELYEKVGVR